VEEGVILRRGSLVLAPSEEKSTVVSKTPSVSIYTNTGAGGFFFYRHRRFSVGLCGLWVPDFSSPDLGHMDVAPPAPTP
jgi:hypothetical protein